MQGKDESIIANDAWFYLQCNGIDDYKLRFRVEDFKVYPKYNDKKMIE